MTKERFSQLMHGPSQELSETEVMDGWHFCPDWDGLLIRADSEEGESCSCPSAFPGQLSEAP